MALGSCRNDPLKDKQAVAANVTPQRVKDFHRGLSNLVYLFCVNCSDVLELLIEVSLCCEGGLVMI